MGIEGINLNIKMAIYDRHTAGIILNGKKIESFSFKIRSKTTMQSLTTHSMYAGSARQSDYATPRNTEHSN